METKRTELIHVLVKNGFMETTFFRMVERNESAGGMTKFQPLNGTRWFEKKGSVELCTEVTWDEVRVLYFNECISCHKIEDLNHKMNISLVSFFLLPDEIRRVIITRKKDLFYLYRDWEMVEQISELQKKNEGIQLMKAFNRVEL
jgi:hypothetical protein